MTYNDYPPPGYEEERVERLTSTPSSYQPPSLWIWVAPFMLFQVVVGYAIGHFIGKYW